MAGEGKTEDSLQPSTSPQVCILELWLQGAGGIQLAEPGSVLENGCKDKRERARGVGAR